MKYQFQVRRSSVFELAVSAVSLFFCFLMLGAPRILAEQSNGETIKVGVLLHLGGDFAAWGNAYLQGIEIARDMINQSPANKRKLSIVVEDTRFESKLTASASKRFLEIEKIPAALVSTFTESMVAGPLFERARVPLLVIGDSGSEIDTLGAYIFSSGTWTKGYGLAASRYFRERLKLSEVALLTTANPWSQATAQVFMDDFKAQGGTIVERSELNPDQSDFRALISKLKARGVKGLFAPITAHPVEFFKQAYQLGLSIPVITAGGALDADTINAAGVAVEGRLVTNSYLDPQRLEARSLLELYRRKFKSDPAYPSVTGRGFDGFMILAKAIQRAADLKPETIARELQATDYRGAGTNFRMDANGGAPLPVRVLGVKQGMLEAVD